MILSKVVTQTRGIQPCFLAKTKDFLQTIYSIISSMNFQLQNISQQALFSRDTLQPLDINTYTEWNCKYWEYLQNDWVISSWADVISIDSCISLAWQDLNDDITAYLKNGQLRIADASQKLRILRRAYKQLQFYRVDLNKPPKIDSLFKLLETQTVFEQVSFLEIYYLVAQFQHILQFVDLPQNLQQILQIKFTVFNCFLEIYQLIINDDFIFGKEWVKHIEQKIKDTGNNPLKVMVYRGLRTVQGVCHCLNYIQSTLKKRKGFSKEEYAAMEKAYEVVLLLNVKRKDVRQRRLCQVGSQSVGAKKDHPYFEEFLLQQDMSISLNSFNSYRANCNMQQQQRIEHLGCYLIQRISSPLRLCLQIQAISAYYKSLTEQCLKMRVEKMLEKMLVDILEMKAEECQGLVHAIEKTIDYLQISFPAMTRKYISRIRDELIEGPFFKIITKMMDALATAKHSQDSDAMQKQIQMWTACIAKRRVIQIENFTGPEFSLIYSKELENAMLRLHYGKNQLRQYFSGKVKKGNGERLADLVKILNLLVENARCENKAICKVMSKYAYQGWKKAVMMIKSRKDEENFIMFLNVGMALNKQLELEKVLEMTMEFAQPFAKLGGMGKSQAKINAYTALAQQYPIETLRFIALKYPNCAVDFHLVERDREEFLSYFIVHSREPQMLKAGELEFLFQVEKFLLLLQLFSELFQNLNQSAQCKIKEIKKVYEWAVIIIDKFTTRWLQPILQTCISYYVRHLFQVISKKQTDSHIVCEKIDSFLPFLNVFRQINEIGQIKKHTFYYSLKAKLNSLPQLHYPSHITETAMEKLIITLIFSIEQYVFADFQLDDSQLGSFIKVREGIMRDINKISSFKFVKEYEWKYVTNDLPTDFLVELQKVLTFNFDKLLCLTFTECFRCLLTLIKLLSHDQNTCINSFLEQLIVVLKKGHNRCKCPNLAIICKEIMATIFQFNIEYNFQINSYYAAKICHLFNAFEPGILQQTNKTIIHYIGQCYRRMENGFVMTAKMVKLQQGSGVKYSDINFKKKNLMQINLLYFWLFNFLSRLNFQSLAKGFPLIYANQAQKSMYLDYVLNFTIKARCPISKRAEQILNSDTYGNLAHVFDSEYPDKKMLDKLLLLAQEIVHLKCDVTESRELITRIILSSTQKIKLDLSIFEQMEEYPHLAMLSIQSKVESLLKSNLHLCNLIYLSGADPLALKQNIKLNKEKYQLSKATLAHLKSINWNCHYELELKKPQLADLLEPFWNCRKNVSVRERISKWNILISFCLSFPQLILVVLSPRPKDFLTTLMEQWINFSSYYFVSFYLCVIQKNQGWHQGRLVQIQLIECLLNRLCLQLLSPKCNSNCIEALMASMKLTKKYLFKGYTHNELKISSYIKEVNLIIEKISSIILNHIGKILSNKANFPACFGLYHQLIEIRFGQNVINSVKPYADSQLCRQFNSKPYGQTIPEIESQTSATGDWLRKLFEIVSEEKLTVSIPQVKDAQPARNLISPCKQRLSVELAMQLKDLNQILTNNDDKNELITYYHKIENMKLQQFKTQKGATDYIITKDDEESESQQTSFIVQSQANQQEVLQNLHQETDGISKNQFLNYIEEYALNPQALKTIAQLIPRMQTTDLEKTYAISQVGQVKALLEAELHKRKIVERTTSSSYKHNYLDQSFIYKKSLTPQSLENWKTIRCLTPQVNKQFARGYILHKSSLDHKGRCHKFDTIMFNPKNLSTFISCSLKLLKENSYGVQREEEKKAESQKIVDYVIECLFAGMVEHRIGLQGLLFCSEHYIDEEKTSVLGLIFGEIILKGTSYKSRFLKQLNDYVDHNLRGGLGYPYYNLNMMNLDEDIVFFLCENMKNKRIRFFNGDNNEQILMIMIKLKLQNFTEYLHYNLQYLTNVGDQLLKAESESLERFICMYENRIDDMLPHTLAEIYAKKFSFSSSQQLQQLNYHVDILMDIVLNLLPKFKAIFFQKSYHQEQILRHTQIESIRMALQQRGQFKYGQNYEEVKELRGRLQLKQKQLVEWKRVCINQLIQELIPIFKELAADYINTLVKFQPMLFEYESYFGIQNYKIYELFICLYDSALLLDAMEQEQQILGHSMSILKTKPRIQSIKDTITGRRRSSIRKSQKMSIKLSKSNLRLIIKRTAFMIDRIGLTDQNPLLKFHQKYSKLDYKTIILAQRKNKFQKLISCRREKLWADTIPYLDDTFSVSNIIIQIKGEIGSDYGGIAKEWITLLSKQLTDPRFGLFELNANGLALQPSKSSSIVPNHLFHFEKFGMIVGKAIKEQWLLQISFTRSFLKHLLGFKLYVQDLEDLEPDTVKGLMWILENQIDQTLGLTFSYQTTLFGSQQVKELVPGGTEILVTEQNKKQYVKQLAYAKMATDIRDQSKAFMRGLENVIPFEDLRMFNYKEIAIHLAGCPIIDVKQMRKFCIYSEMPADSQKISWFWQVIEAQEQSWLAEFLFFLTGSYKVPYGGFEHFPITLKHYSEINYLPVAHTCFSLLDLPDFTSKEKLALQLKKAVQEGKGFSVS